MRRTDRAGGGGRGAGGVQYVSRRRRWRKTTQLHHTIEFLGKTSTIKQPGRDRACVVSSHQAEEEERRDQHVRAGAALHSVHSVLNMAAEGGERATGKLRQQSVGGWHRQQT